MTRLGARLVGGLLTVIACMASLLAQSERVRERDSKWTAPAKDVARTNPLVDQPNVAAGGRKLYGQRCSACHGDGGRGTNRAPNLVAVDVQGQTDGTLFWKIGSGDTLSGMPSFSFLPETQRWQLVLHLRSLSRDGR